jgi:hypothetical protein
VARTGDRFQIEHEKRRAQPVPRAPSNLICPKAGP